MKARSEAFVRFHVQVRAASPARLLRRSRSLTTALALLLGLVLVPVTAPAVSAAPATPQQAIDSGAAYAASRGPITTYAAVVDRHSGKLVATRNAYVQVASESIVKLFIAAYYLIQYNGRLPAGLNSSMSYMIRYSDDRVASQYFNYAAVPLMVRRYGLSTLTANPAGGWGATKITAADMALFIHRMSLDPVVGPSLLTWMAQTTDYGSDGFNQNYGFNALVNTGSKQGWGAEHWTWQRSAIHSVGYTGRWAASVLQTGGGGTYYTMRDTATYTARQIDASYLPDPRTPTLSLTAAPNPAYVGTPVTLTGTLRTADGKPIAGTAVSVLSAPGTAALVYRGAIRTNAQGNWSFTTTQSVDSQRWVARYAAPGVTTAFSPTLIVRARPLPSALSISVRPSSVPAGSPVTLSGSFWTLNHAPIEGAGIALFSRTANSEWTYRGAVTTAANGSYSIALSAQNATLEWQARYRSSGRWFYAADSAVVTTTIVQPAEQALTSPTRVAPTQQPTTSAPAAPTKPQESIAVLVPGR